MYGCLCVFLGRWKLGTAREVDQAHGPFGGGDDFVDSELFI